MKNSFVKLTILLGIIGVCSIFEIRICLFYHIFKIPCPGCGLTRSILSILKLDIIGSFKYNILGLPILVFIIILIVGNMYDVIKKEKAFNNFLKKYSKLLIIISILLFIISWIVNLNNPILY